MQSLLLLLDSAFATQKQPQTGHKPTDVVVFIKSYLHKQAAVWIRPWSIVARALSYIHTDFLRVLRQTASLSLQSQLFSL